MVKNSFLTAALLGFLFLLATIAPAQNLAWADQVGTGSNQTLCGGIVVDSSQNAYVPFIVGSAGGSYSLYFAKVGAADEEEFNNLLITENGTITPLGAAISPPGTSSPCVVVGALIPGTDGYPELWIDCFDLGGTPLWSNPAVYESYESAPNLVGFGMDTSNNVYVALNVRTSSNPGYLYLAKLNSSGGVASTATNTEIDPQSASYLANGDWLVTGNDAEASSALEPYSARWGMINPSSGDILFGAAADGTLASGQYNAYQFLAAPLAGSQFYLIENNTKGAEGAAYTSSDYSVELIGLNRDLRYRYPSSGTETGILQQMVSYSATSPIYARGFQGASSSGNYVVGSFSQALVLNWSMAFDSQALYSDNVGFYSWFNNAAGKDILLDHVSSSGTVELGTSFTGSSANNSVGGFAVIPNNSSVIGVNLSSSAGGNYFGLAKFINAVGCSTIEGPTTAVFNSKITLDVYLTAAAPSATEVYVSSNSSDLTFSGSSSAHIVIPAGSSLGEIAAETPISGTPATVTVTATVDNSVRTVAINVSG